MSTKDRDSFSLDSGDDSSKSKVFGCVLKVGDCDSAKFMGGVDSRMLVKTSRSFDSRRRRKGSSINSRSSSR